MNFPWHLPWPSSCIRNIAAASAACSSCSNSLASWASAAAGSTTSRIRLPRIRRALASWWAGLVEQPLLRLRCDPGLGFVGECVDGVDDDRGLVDQELGRRRVRGVPARARLCPTPWRASRRGGSRPGWSWWWWAHQFAVLVAPDASPIWFFSPWAATRSFSSATRASARVSSRSVARVCSSSMDQVETWINSSKVSCISLAATVIGCPRCLVDAVVVMGLFQQRPPTFRGRIPVHNPPVRSRSGNGLGGLSTGEFPALLQGSRRRGRSFLAPAARPTKPHPLVEQAEPLGEAVVETPQAGTRTGPVTLGGSAPGSRRRGRSFLAPAARPTKPSRPQVGVVPIGAISGRRWAGQGREAAKRTLDEPIGGRHHRAFGRTTPPQLNVNWTRRVGRISSGVSTTRSLVPRSRCSTNKRPHRWSSRPSPWARPLSRPRKLARELDPSRWADRLRGLDDAVARSSLPLLDQQTLTRWSSGRAPGAKRRSEP